MKATRQELSDIKEKYCFSEDDFKKISRELNSLYETNKDFEKENKRLKNELRVS